MCVDYIDLNQAYLKDYYTLPRIVQLVDFTSDMNFSLSWMPSHAIIRSACYNQICMAPRDQEHTSFIINRGLYYDEVIPFDLKC